MERELNQEAVARGIGTSRTHYTKVETGKSVPGRKMLEALAAFFSVSLDWLLHGAGDRAKPMRQNTPSPGHISQTEANAEEPPTIRSSTPSRTPHSRVNAGVRPAPPSGTPTSLLEAMLLKAFRYLSPEERLAVIEDALGGQAGSAASA
jgi:DNA-binding XRE family transcriptional regulator